MRNLHVMAESTQCLSNELKAAHPDIQWSGITGFRNLLVHDYFGVDLSVVWHIGVKDVPELKAAVLGMLKD